jgi:hypothetical protein
MADLHSLRANLRSPTVPVTTTISGRQRQQSRLGSVRGLRTFGLALVGLVSLLTASPCSAQSVTFKKMDDVSDKVGKQFMNDFYLRKETLEHYLTTTNFTQLFSGKFEVEVFEKDQVHSEALLFVWDGNRGHIYFPPHRVKTRSAAILHEIAHVHAPNAVRFLAEGFPAYLEEKMGDINAFPTEGSRVECAMRRYKSALPSVKLERFDSVPTKRKVFLGDKMGLDFPDDEEGERDRRAYSYMVSASFVKFLIHTHGQDRFKALYALTPLIPREAKEADAGRYQRIYGKSLTELQAGWLTWVGQRQANCL